MRKFFSLALAAFTQPLTHMSLRSTEQWRMFRSNDNEYNSKLERQRKMHIEKLALVNQEIAKGEDPSQTPNLYSTMVDWFKLYVFDDEHLATYSYPRDLELAAEATFWSVQLGLAPQFEKMNMDYAAVQAFDPLQHTSRKTKLGKLINDVAGKLERYNTPDDLAFALKQAVWATYLHSHTYEKKQLEKSAYQQAKLAQQKPPRPSL